MSISGSLEDVSVADVMQFIHLGRRTGTLVLASGRDRGMIGFHKGRLVSARGPGTPKLGDMLVESGVLDRAALDTAILEQQAAESPVSLGQVLISEGKLEEEALRQVVSEQIEKTIAELVQWDSGSFEFAVDDLRPIDEIALFPGDLVPGTDMNTQMVLLEAARIFDERNRHDGESHAAQDETASSTDDTHPMLEFGGEEADESWAAVGRAVEGAVRSGAAHSEAPGAEVQPPASGRHVVHLVSADDELAVALGEALPQEVDRLERLGLEDAGHRREGYLQPIVLVDLREGQANLGDVAVLHDRNPGASIVALVDRVVPVSLVYGAGALAALPAEVEAAVACIVNVMQSQQQLARIGAGAQGSKPQPLGSGVARLRRVFGDLRSGLLSATVALNLMHIISESVERAVLFLVRHDCLQALGAFGMGTGGRPLAELTRGMRLDLDEPSILIDSLTSGEANAVDFDKADLPANLRQVLQRPLTGQVVVFPVLGAQRVISIIYTDNGDVNRPIEDIEILELATAQVGMAFENELLRRKISQHEL